MSGVIWVCDTCGKQCKTDDERSEHARQTNPRHELYTPIPEDQTAGDGKFIAERDRVPEKFEPISFLAKIIDIKDEVLDKIADRVVEKLIKREEEATEEIMKMYGKHPPSRVVLRDPKEKEEEE